MPERCRASRALSRRFVAAIVVVLALGSLSGQPADAKDKVRKLKARELIAMQESGARVVVVDTRGGDVEYKIPGAEQVPLDALDRWAASRERETPVVVYCT